MLSGRKVFLERLCSSLDRLRVRGVHGSRALSSTVETSKPELDLELAQEEWEYEEDEEKAARLQELRNKSRLNPQHLNILQGKRPYEEPLTDFHTKHKYQSKLFGRLGHQSQVNVAKLWPTKEEIAAAQDYEAVQYPVSLLESVQQLKLKEEEEQTKVIQRQRAIAANLAKLDKWKADIEARASKKLREAEAAKAKKDALVEEVRRQLGYKIDPRDEKFQEALLMKERDMKKKLKAERAAARQQRLLATLDPPPK